MDNEYERRRSEAVLAEYHAIIADSHNGEDEARDRELDWGLHDRSVGERRTYVPPGGNS